MFCQSISGYAMAYFYFDFSDTEKRQYGSLLRSLITQLALQNPETQELLNRLYSQCQNGQTEPSIDKLEATLHALLKEQKRAFFVLDALDECQEREPLLRLIGELIDGNSGNVNILATSRKEYDIEVALDPLACNQICIQNSLVDVDISLHVDERLRNDPKLKRFPQNIKDEIRTALVKGSLGM